MITMPPSHVHLWCCRTDHSEVAGRQSILSAEERLRASRFHDARTARTFMAAHIWLRDVLSTYIDVPPRLIRFQQDSYGKPALELDFDGPAVSFNLSHSGELAIVAVMAGRPIGVDIERIRAVPGDVAEQLAPGEITALAHLPPPQRETAFIACWTRKEAYLKAIGAGLNIPLSSFEVSTGLSSPAQILKIGSDRDEAAHWRLLDIDPAPGYCGAVAARQHDLSPVWMARPKSELPSEI